MAAGLQMDEGMAEGLILDPEGVPDLGSRQGRGGVPDEFLNGCEQGLVFMGLHIRRRIRGRFKVCGIASGIGHKVEHHGLWRGL